jgi:hypothetical protein
MSEERKRVLEMLAAGKITAEEAEKLLDKLSIAAANPSAGAEPPAADAARGAAKPKYLRVVVDHPGREQVNMRVPLSLINSGKGFLALMPKGVNERLAEYGINAGTFTGMDCGDLGQAMRELNVDVEKSDGKKVHIYCE